MQTPINKKHFFLSLGAHIAILLIFILGFDFAVPLPVLENTNKNDVISAVVLGDSAKSKLIPQKMATLPPVVKKTAPPPPRRELVKPKVEPLPDKDVIALKKAEEKQKKKIKELELKKLMAQKQRELFGKDLLADIKTARDKQKKKIAKKVKPQFEKMLHEQAEKSLREQLLNEEIKLQGKQSRQAQGEVNKYKALILQSISEHWIIPVQANKSLSCELMIRLAPGGMVLDVQVTRTSGDPSLDSSARTAVLKASPLPVPPDLGAFESFRQFVLKVKPENVIAAM